MVNTVRSRRWWERLMRTGIMEGFRGWWQQRGGRRSPRDVCVLLGVGLWLLLGIGHEVGAQTPTPTPAATPTAGTGWIYNPATGHHYTRTTRMSRSSAASLAGSWGGYLVTINDADEEAFIKSHFSNYEMWIGLHRTGYSLGGQDLWTGLMVMAAGGRSPQPIFQGSRSVM